MNASKVEEALREQRKYGVVTIAGTGKSGYSDGVGTNAALDLVHGLCMAGDSLLLVESGAWSKRVRRLILPTAETRKTLLPVFAAVLISSGLTVAPLFEMIADYAVSRGMNRPPRILSCALMV